MQEDHPVHRRRSPEVFQKEILRQTGLWLLLFRLHFPDTITADTTFVDDLGVDSLDFFQILIDLEETFDVRIAPEEAEEIVTVGDAVETLRRVTKGRRNGK